MLGNKCSKGAWVESVFTLGQTLHALVGEHAVWPSNHSNDPRLRSFLTLSTTVLEGHLKKWCVSEVGHLRSVHLKWVQGQCSVQAILGVSHQSGKFLDGNLDLCARHLMSKHKLLPQRWTPTVLWNNSVLHCIKISSHQNLGLKAKPWKTSPGQK